MKTFSILSVVTALLVVVSCSPSAHILAKQTSRMMTKTMHPSLKPSSDPSETPSNRPSSPPSSQPSSTPSVSAQPSSTPSQMPSTQPSHSVFPSSAPSKCLVVDSVLDLLIPIVQQCAGLDLDSGKKTALLTKLDALAESYVNCITTEKGVRDAIKADQELILLCPDTNITLTSPIDVTNRRFEMRCLEAPSQLNGGSPSCNFDGGGTSQLFIANSYDHDVNFKFYGVGFLNGKASGIFNGGAVWLKSKTGNVKFDSCLFENNVVEFFFGGALSVDMHNMAEGGFVVVMNSIFRNNRAYSAGGAISVAFATLTVQSSTFTGNAATFRPQEFNILGADATIDCAFRGNSFPDGAGNVNYVRGTPNTVIC